MSIDDVQLDVLDSGREPDRRRRAAAVVLAAVLVVALLAGWLIDHRSRQGEFTAISGCARQASTAYSSSTARVAAMAEYVRPALAFATEPTATSMYGMVAHEAESIDDDLARARARCGAVAIHSWHNAQRDALSAQLDLQDGQLGLLSRTAADGRVYFFDQGPLSELQATAIATLAAARPTLVP